MDSDPFLSAAETNTFVPSETTTDGQNIETFSAHAQKWKTKLKQLTDNVDKCTEVVDVVSPLQQLDLKEIATQGKS